LRVDCAKNDEAMTSTSSHTDPHRAVARLGRAEFWACFLGAMAVFFLAQGPLWRHRWQLDISIFYSYLVVPVLVAGALAYRKKWSLASFALGTLEVTVWKFGATYVIAHTLWMFSPPPPKTRPLPAESAIPERESPVVATPIAKEATGAIQGTVTGAGSARVIVYVASGLESFTFAPSAGSPELLVGASIQPGIAVAELNQELRARSSDGRLHTLIAGIEDADLFNVPLQSSGAWSGAKVRRGQGVAQLRCAVHPHSGETGSLVVVGHPFHAMLDGDGRFDWEGVPAGHVVIAALGSGGRQAKAEVEVVAGGSVQAQLKLGAGDKP
jgi:hypothetical protein